MALLNVVGENRKKTSRARKAFRQEECHENKNGEATEHMAS